MPEFAQVTNGQLAYEQSGAGEPVVCIHGALIAESFHPLLNPVGAANAYRMILYHRRGYGESSPAEGPVPVSRQVADCQHLLDHLGVRRAHLVGHSFGGAVALQLALDAPELVHTLALIEPALMAGESGPAYRESLLRAIDRYRSAGAETVVDEFLAARLPDHRAVLERELPGALGKAVRDAGTTFESDLPGLLDWTFDEGEARRISCPTLSILGAESMNLSPRFLETHQFLLSRVSSADGITLPGLAHLSQFEDPERVGEALVEFWSRHPMAAGAGDHPRPDYEPRA